MFSTLQETSLKIFFRCEDMTKRNPAYAFLRGLRVVRPCLFKLDEEIDIN